MKTRHIPPFLIRSFSAYILIVGPREQITLSGALWFRGRGAVRLGAVELGIELDLLTRKQPVALDAQLVALPADAKVGPDGLHCVMSECAGLCWD